MTSSLAQQLGQIRSHNADRLRNEASTSRSLSTSYLFPPKVASAQDLHTLFGLGSNGLAELCDQDAAVSKFSESSSGELLFGPSSRELDRLMVTKDENKDLDEAIGEFFDTVGGLLLEKSTSKCIEWLVRRFRIHEFNVETTLSAFMPYHQTQHFARMLQILRIRDKPQLAFLLPVQQRAVPLPSSVLISVLLGPTQTSPALETLRWVANLVGRGIDQRTRLNHALLSFWTSTLLKVCAGWSRQLSHSESLSMGLTKGGRKRRSKGRRDDDAQLILNVLLPTTVDLAMTKRGGEEARIAGCMVLSAIGTSFLLSASAIRSIVGSLASATEKANARISKAIFAAICSVVQSASTSEAEDPFSASIDDDGKELLMPLGATERLACFQSCADTVIELSKTHQLDFFISHFLVALTENLFKQASDSQEQLVQTLEGVLEASSSEVTLSLTKKMLSNVKGAQHSSIIACLARIRQKQPKVVDRALVDLTSKEQEVRKDRNANIWEAMRMVMAAQAGTNLGKNVGKASSTLWIGINDAEAGTRIVALKSMFASIEDGSMARSDPFVKDTITSRISDDSPEVLKILYSHPEMILESATVKTLVSLVSTALSVATSPTLSNGVLGLHIEFVLKHLAGKNPEMDMEILLKILWPFLLFSSGNVTSCLTIHEQLRSFSQSIMAPPNGNATSLLARVSSAICRDVQSALKANDLCRANAAISKAIAFQLEESARDVQKATTGFLVLQAKDGGKHSNALANLVLISWIDIAAPSRKQQLSSRIVKEVKFEIDNALDFANNPDYYQFDSMLKTIYDDQEKESTILATLRIALLHQMITSIPIEEDMVLGAAGEPLGTFRFIYELSCSSSSKPVTSQKLLGHLFKRLAESSLVFLANVWTSSVMPVNTRFAALRHANVFFSALEDTNKKELHTHTDFQTVLPALLLTLKARENTIRKEGLSCLVVMARAAASVESNRKTSPIKTFGYDSIYGKSQSEELKYLDPAEVKRLVEMLGQENNSFINDADYLDVWCKEHLTPPPKVQGKKDVAFKRTLISYLSSHAMAWPDQRAKLGLLEALNGVGDATKLEQYLPVIRRLADSPSTVVEQRLRGLKEGEKDCYLRFLFGAYDRTSQHPIQSDQGWAWTAFLNALGSEHLLVAKHAALALQDRIFGLLSIDRRKEVLERLLVIICHSKRSVAPELRSCLAKLDIAPTIIAAIVEELRATVAGGLQMTPRTKRAKSSAPPSSSDTSTNEASSNAAVILIEVLETLLSRQAKVSGILIFELFEVLRVATEMLLSQVPNAEYLMQLSMSCVGAIVNEVQQEDVPVKVTQSLRADTLVNVVKTSTNPQTFQQALLLLSSLARLAPEIALHNAMPIFTFVGSTMLQRDDSFSFTVIERTLRSIVPHLVSSIRARVAASRPGTDHLALLQQSRSLLCVFTDAANHVPRHRRTAFFQLLAEVMGEKDFLSAVCLLLVDRTARKVARQSPSDAEATMALPLYVMQSHSGPTQLRALNQIWQEVERIYEHQEEDTVEAQAHIFLDCVSQVQQEHSGPKLDPLRRISALLRFIRAATASPTFSGKVEDDRERMGKENSVDDSLEHFSRHALQASLFPEDSMRMAARDSLKKITSLASVDTLIKVSRSLLADDDAGRKQSALELLAERLPRLANHERERAAKHTPNVIDVAYSLALQESNGDLLRVAGLNTLCAIASDCLAAEQGPLGAKMGEAIRCAADNHQALVVRQGFLNLLLKLAKKLGPRVIAHLSTLVPTCTSLVDAATRGPEDVHSTLSNLVPDALEILTALCQSVPTFMETYVGSLIQLCTLEAFVYRRELRLLDDRAYSRMHKVFEAIAKHLPAPKALEATYELWHRGDHSIKSLHLGCLLFIGRIMRTISRADMMSVYKSIFRFLLRYFDLRRLQGDALSPEDLDVLENVGVDTFFRLVLKLNEATFRPLFLRIHDWAALDLVEEEEANVWDLGLCSRRVVLYKVMNILQDKLRDLVSTYYGTVLDLTLELLDAYADKARLVSRVEANDKRYQVTFISLWHEVMSSLQRSARYDQGTFWNPTAFSKAVPSVVAQLSSSIVVGEDRVDSINAKSKNKSNSELVASSLAFLARAVPDEGSLKLLNSRLLTQCRRVGDIEDVFRERKMASSAQREMVRTARVAALEATTTLWSQDELNQTLLGLVPETVPHISEMLDDDDDAVKEAVARLVEVVEGVLGEPLDSYLL